MPALMADNDIRGQFEALVRYLTSETWGDLWNLLGLTVVTFESLGLSETDPDMLVWQACQAHGVLLVTGNRSSHSPDSLEAAIRALNQPTSLPVFTLSDANRFRSDRAYAERVADRLMDYLAELDKFLGTGRLWLP
jgi:hypothetical protein